MTLMSEVTYYLTLLEQMIVFTFAYHHISKPKKSYAVTVGFYFACVALVHVALIPFGNEAMNAFLPHLFLILAQIPVLFLYEDTLLHKALMFIGNFAIQTVTEIAVSFLFGLLTRTATIDYATVDYSSAELSAARIMIIDVFMLIAVLLIALFRRDRSVIRDMGLIAGFVSGHLAFLSAYLYFAKEALTEIGVMLQLAFQTMFCILLIMQYYGIRNRRKLLQSETELKTLHLQMDNNEKYYKLAESRFTEISKLRHDIQAQIQTASVLLHDSEGQESAEQIMDTIRQRLDDLKATNYCENRTLNAVLSVKLNDPRWKPIRTEIVLRDCGELPFDDYDLCSLISNLFDNAAECCLLERHPDETVITLKSGIRSGCFLIRCVNTCSVPPADGKSTKAETGHGYGISIIRSICQKYDGEYTLRYEGGKAIATVAIQLESDADNVPAYSVADEIPPEE